MDRANAGGIHLIETILHVAEIPPAVKSKAIKLSVSPGTDSLMTRLQLRKPKMKRMIRFVLLGMTFVTGLQQAVAQKWDQNLVFALTAQVQTDDGTAKRVAINTKQMLALLSGITGGTNLIMVTNTETLTNTVDTPLPLPGSPFPTNFVLTDYSVVVDGQSFTNGVDFFNDITFTRTSTSPVTYTFQNAVPVGTNGTGFLLPDFHTDPLTAVLVSSNEPAYTITGISTNIPPTTPVFSRTARLLVVRDLILGSDTFIVRDGRRPNFVDTDVTAFFGTSTILTVTQNRPRNAFIDYSHFVLTFDNSAGGLSSPPQPTTFTLDGASTQVSSPLKVRGTDFGTVRRSLAAIVVGSGQSGVTGISGPMVLSGRVGINGGALESQ